MVLTKENKAALFELMQSCDTKDDVSYIRQLLGLREKEIEAAMPKGMSGASASFWRK